MTQEEDDAKLLADANAMAKKHWGVSFDEFLDTPAGQKLVEQYEAMPREQRMKQGEAQIRYLEGVVKKQEEWKALSEEEKAEKREEHIQWMKDVWNGKLPME